MSGLNAKPGDSSVVHLSGGESFSYARVTGPYSGVQLSCLQCGAVVYDTRRHTSWHQTIDPPPVDPHETIAGAKTFRDPL